jgi:hypothetical protein
MSPKMTRRHWFGSLVAGVLGLCASRRAVAGPPGVVPAASPTLEAYSTITECDGSVMVFSFDAANRLTTVQGPDGTADVHGAGPGSIPYDG